MCAGECVTIARAFVIAKQVERGFSCLPANLTESVQQSTVYLWNGCLAMAACASAAADSTWFSF